MSIAVAVVIHPSKLLRYGVMLFSSLLIVLGIYVACLTHLSVLTRCILVVCCYFAAWRGILYSQQIAKSSWQLIVNNHGQLWCQLNSKSSTNASTKYFAKGRAVNLTAGTTLWTYALFLRLLSQEQNQKINLIIFPDSVSKEEFRRLSVACRWVVARIG